MLFPRKPTQLDFCATLACCFRLTIAATITILQQDSCTLMTKSLSYFGADGAAKICHGGMLNFRDIRRLITSLSNGCDMSICVRRHVILINFDPLKCIVLWDRLIVLIPDGADSILNVLEENFQQAITNEQAFLQELMEGE